MKVPFQALTILTIPWIDILDSSEPAVRMSGRPQDRATLAQVCNNSQDCAFKLCQKSRVRSLCKERYACTDYWPARTFGLSVLKSLEHVSLLLLFDGYRNVVMVIAGVMDELTSGSSIVVGSRSSFTRVLEFMRESFVFVPPSSSYIYI